MLSFAKHFTQNKVSTRNPRHSGSTDIKLWKFKTLLCNHHTLKPGHIPVHVQWIEMKSDGAYCNLSNIIYNKCYFYILNFIKQLNYITCILRINMHCDYDQLNLSYHVIHAYRDIDATLS